MVDCDHILVRWLNETNKSFKVSSSHLSHNLPSSHHLFCNDHDKIREMVDGETDHDEMVDDLIFPSDHIPLTSSFTISSTNNHLPSHEEKEEENKIKS